jgi:hypothetical protein
MRGGPARPSYGIWFRPAQEKDLVRLKREAKAKGGFYVPPEAKVVFVVRIRGLNKVAPKVRVQRSSWGRVTVTEPPPEA